MLYFSTWGKFATFQDRATRSEYWTFVILTPIITFILSLICFKFGWTFINNEGTMEYATLSVAFALLSIIPHIAVSIRRIHDIGLSGWWGWLFIPLALPMLIVGFIRSTKDTKYGEIFKEIKPKEDVNKHTVSFQIKDNNSWNNLKMILINFYKKENFTNVISDKESSFMLGSDNKKGYIGMTLDKDIVTIVIFKALKLDSEIIKSEMDLESIKAENIISEDEIYEKVMIEIEDNKKVKSTWAKAFSQSNGDKNKAEALYINLRVKDITKA